MLKTLFLTIVLGTVFVSAKKSHHRGKALRKKDASGPSFGIGQCQDRLREMLTARGGGFATAIACLDAPAETCSLVNVGASIFTHSHRFTQTMNL